MDSDKTYSQRFLFTGNGMQVFSGLESLLYFNIVKPGPNGTWKVPLSDCIFALFENKLSIFNKVNNVKFFEHN